MAWSTVVVQLRGRDGEERWDHRRVRHKHHRSVIMAALGTRAKRTVISKI